MIVIDVETTGFARHHEVWEAALVELDAACEIISTWSAFWVPARPDAHGAALDVNGFCDRDWGAAVRRDDAIVQMRERLRGQHVVALGSLDKRMVGALLDDAPWSIWTDALPRARKRWPGWASHTLDSMCANLSIERGWSHHAPDDARALAAVWQRLVVG